MTRDKVREILEKSDIYESFTSIEETGKSEKLKGVEILGFKVGEKNVTPTASDM